MDQAKRGYDVADDSQGQIMWYNPSYMKYSPVDSVTASKEGKVTLDDLDKRGLPTLKNTVATTAILEAGRMSLDESRTVQILKDNGE